MTNEPRRNVYVGHRYVPKIMDEWDKSISYEGLSIVTYQGGSYTSKKYVPKGIDINNTEYWTMTGNYNAQVEQYRQEVKNLQNSVSNDLLTLNEAISDTNKIIDDVKNKNNEVSLNIKYLGVKGDGTDETEKISEALNESKGRVYFPDGHYKITETILINHNDIILEFSPNAVVTFDKVTQYTPAFHFKGSQGSEATVSLDITEFTNTIHLETIPLDFSVGDWIQITTDEIVNSRARAYDTKREFGKITHVDRTLGTITLASPIIFSYSSLENTKVTKQNFLKNVGVINLNLNGVGSNLHFGVMFDRCFQPFATDCNIKDIGNTAIYIQDSVFGFISNSYAQINYRESLQYGIVVHGSMYTVISGNQIHSSRTAIDVTRVSSFITVVGNTSYSGGINTHTCRHITIANNTIHGAGFLLRGGYINLTGNIAYANEDRFTIDTHEAAIDGNINIQNNLFIGRTHLRIEGGSNNTISNNIFKVTDYLSYAPSDSSIVRFNGLVPNINFIFSNNIIDYIGTKEPPLYGLHMWDLNEAENFTISGNTINNVKVPIMMARRNVIKRKNLKIINNTLNSVGDYGIHFGGWDNVIVKGNTLTGVNNFTEGIRSWGNEEESYSTVIIKDNTIENSIIPIRIYGGSTQFLYKKGIVKDNIFINNTDLPVISGIDPDKSVIADNI